MVAAIASTANLPLYAVQRGCWPITRLQALYRLVNGDVSWISTTLSALAATA
ncbi:MAG: hypothetical protein QG671_2400 [Actinomycetota bacterium]|nr:hypothetical protein [Actinomycetota bacterium]